MPALEWHGMAAMAWTATTQCQAGKHTSSACHRHGGLTQKPAAPSAHPRPAATSTWWAGRRWCPRAGAASRSLPTSTWTASLVPAPSRSRQVWAWVPLDLSLHVMSSSATALAVTCFCYSKTCARTIPGAAVPFRATLGSGALLPQHPQTPHTSAPLLHPLQATM